MRLRINKDLVWTTSESETKINYAKQNKEQNPKPKVKKFITITFGKRKYISLEDYLRLKKAGIECDIVEE